VPPSRGGLPSSDRRPVDPSRDNPGPRAWSSDHILDGSGTHPGRRVHGRQTAIVGSVRLLHEGSPSDLHSGHTEMFPWHWQHRSRPPRPTQTVFSYCKYPRDTHIIIFCHKLLSNLRYSNFLSYDTVCPPFCPAVILRYYGKTAKYVVELSSFSGLTFHSSIQLLLDVRLHEKKTLRVSWGALQRGPGGPWPTQNFGWVGHNAFGPTNNWPVCSLAKLV